MGALILVQNFTDSETVTQRGKVVYTRSHVNSDRSKAGIQGSQSNAFLPIPPTIPSTLYFPSLHPGSHLSYAQAIRLLLYLQS